MKMFRINHRIKKSLMEFANGCQSLLSGKIQNGRHEITKVIFTNNLDIDKIISPNHVFGIKEYNKQTIHSFDINIMQNFKWPP